MNQHEQRELKQDILDKLENWWRKVEENVSVPGLPRQSRRSRFEVRIYYPGDFVPEYFCPYPEMSVYDRKYSWGYTKVLQRRFVEICTNRELYFNRIAEDIYHIFEEEDQKRIKELLNKQYGLFATSEIGIGKYTAEVFAQLLDNINKRSYHGNSVDSYRYSNTQRQMDLYRNLLFENDLITNKFKEDLDNMGRIKHRMPRQCAIIFDNGENLLLDVENVKREEMHCSIPPKFELEGRYKCPATERESDLLMRVLGEWRATLKPELSYEKVIFNDPATIVIWKDGTKTIVKVQPGETYDAEKGLALCFMKKVLGNKGNFNNILKKELAQLKTEQPEISIGLNIIDDISITEGIKRARENIKKASDILYACRKGSPTEGSDKETEAANEQNEDS